MVRRQIDGLNRSAEEKHNTTNIRVVIWYETFQENVTAKVGESSSVATF